MNYKLLLVCILSLLISCSDSDDTPQAETAVPVTYNSISGAWKLTEYYDQPLSEGQYLYMVFDRKEHTVVTYSNMDSHNPRKQQGTYSISGDEYYGYTLSGSYGNIAGDWSTTYHVALYPSGYMRWTSDKNKAYRQVFTKVAEVPADILNAE